MEKYKLGEMEYRFAELIWQKEPISSGELAKLCQIEFGWKRTTSYTMLKRLCNRGLFENIQGEVHSCMSKEDFLGEQGNHFLEETFAGSLPRFLAAFSRKNKLSQGEIEEIQALIDAHKEE